jgi:hypothetical protein
MTDEETITLTKPELAKLISTCTASVVEATMAKMQMRNNLENVNTNEYLKIKMILIDTDLQKYFPELSSIRQNLFIKSHLINHSQEFNPESVYDSYDIVEYSIGDSDPCIELLSDCDEDTKRHFVSVMEGITLKRANRGKNSKVDDNERVNNQYRKKFLNFLRACYKRSGK